MEIIATYELLGRVAESGTGAVWKAHDLALDRDVALKQVVATAVESAARLRSEAKTLARLSHPNIVSVFDLIEHGGDLWLVEEWVEGATLPTVLAGAGRLSPPQAVGVVRGALLGLAYAHGNGVVHGDISPANVLLDMSGTSRLIDFGLAAPSGAPGVAGTPGYLSPEAARGQPVGAPSDIYSAAAVLAMLLRGRALFAGPTAEAVLAAQLGSRAPDLSGVESPMRSVLQRGLATAPVERYGSAEQFLAALEDAATRSYGSNWLAHAGIAGLVSAAVTAGGAMGAGAVFSTPAASVSHAALGAATRTGRAGQAKAGHPAITKRLRVHHFAPSHLAVGASVGIVVVGAAVGAVALAHHGKPARKPVAAISAARSIAPRTTAFDLHTVNWNNATVPGRACMSVTDITLHNGTAAIPDPGNPGGSYELKLAIRPQYGQLGNGGPMVAAFSLNCLGIGNIAGNDPLRLESVAVFEASQGRPKLLGLFDDVALGRPTGHGALVPYRVQVRNGAIAVPGTQLRPNDARCCPSGRATATISYRNGHLVVTATTTPPARTTPSPAPTSPNPTQAGQTFTITGHSGRQYVVTVLAEDTITNCAANSYGTAIINFFIRHPCGHGATRRLITIPLDGRVVAMSVITLEIPGPASHPYDNAAAFAKLEQQSGTGSLDDLLRAGVRPPGWPDSIPADEAFQVLGEDQGQTVFDAWYLTGPTASQARALISLEQDIFLTGATVASH